MKVNPELKARLKRTFDKLSLLMDEDTKADAMLEWVVVLQAQAGTLAQEVQRGRHQERQEKSGG